MAIDNSPHFNGGSAISDVVAAGDDYITQVAWLKESNINAGERITLTKLSHVRYQHPDLDEIHKFLTGKLH